MEKMSDREFDRLYTLAMKYATIDAGESDADDPIARMSDKEFDAFYAQAMLNGTIDAD